MNEPADIRNQQYIAWDKELQKILKVQELNFSQWWVQCYKEDGMPAITNDECVKYGEKNSFINEPTDRHILLQYTGRTDNNGVPIYNMDLIELKGKLYLVKIFFESYYLYDCEYPSTPLRCGCIQGKRVGSIYESEEQCNIYGIKRVF